jgi:hypothetical protein
MGFGGNDGSFGPFGHGFGPFGFAPWGASGGFTGGGGIWH